MPGHGPSWRNYQDQHMATLFTMLPSWIFQKHLILSPTKACFTNSASASMDSEAPCLPGWPTFWWNRRSSENCDQRVLIRRNHVDSGIPPTQSSIHSFSYRCHNVSFRDNLPDRVKSTVTVHLIADDCILYHKINSFQNYLQLQEDLKPDRPEPLTGVWL